MIGGAGPRGASSPLTAIVRVAGFAAILLLQTYWFLQPVPVTAKILAAALVGLSLARPADGLLIFAGLSPLSTLIAGLFGSGAGLGSLILEQLAVGIGGGVLLRGTLSSSTRIGLPAMLMAAVAIASAAATLPMAAAPIARSPWDAPLLLELWTRQTAMGSVVWSPLFAALLIVECGLLAWAVERIVRNDPRLATRLVLLALAGHAGAALMNFLPLLGGALNSGAPVETLTQLLKNVRFSRQMDWNAAGSAFALSSIAGIGLMSGTWGRKVGVGLLVGFTALGVWITGSRIAMAMYAGAVLTVTGWRLAGASRRARLAVAGVTVVLGVGLAWIVSNSISRNDPLSHSVKYRAVMFDAGVQLFKDAPVFGIGIAKFHRASARYVEPFLRSVGSGPGENAHNNFLQVLTEQGLVGLAAFFTWLAVILVGGARAQIAKPEFGRGALLLAILACIGTWLTGHPLLVPEFALVFWLYCGILAAQTPAISPTPRRWMAGVLAAGLLVSAPLRAAAWRDAADLEHIGLGVSPFWAHDDSQRYREAGSDFALYLPANGRPVALPFRIAPGAPHSLVVEIKRDGKLLDQIPVVDSEWQRATITIPGESRRFVLIDFAVRSSTAGDPLPDVVLRVGRTVPY